MGTSVSDDRDGWILARSSRPPVGSGAPAARAAAGSATEPTVTALVDLVARLERVVATLERRVQSTAPQPWMRDVPRSIDPLTARQLEILGRLAAGQPTTVIARELHLSVPTVRNHIARALRALGAHSRLEAVVVAQRRGLLASAAEPDAVDGDS
jgi:DNA-binding NarL/FixJ family response regulator